RNKFGEIDIIARSSDGTLVFIEVKTIEAVNSHGYSPEDHMNRQKLEKLRRACEMFSAKHPELINEKKGWRIDLLALTKDNNDVVIKHYENV
ncbi:MAG TPA: YraN family protein, partial [Candidatus Paceibacterota bacterium]|nr:YraN family protein [Candidatus Paceibacterota bacterium]